MESLLELRDITLALECTCNLSGCGPCLLLTILLNFLVSLCLELMRARWGRVRAAFACIFYSMSEVRWLR